MRSKYIDKSIFFFKNIVFYYLIVSRYIIVIFYCFYFLIFKLKHELNNFHIDYSKLNRFYFKIETILFLRDRNSKRAKIQYRRINYQRLC